MSGLNVGFSALFYYDMRECVYFSENEARLKRRLAFRLLENTLTGPKPYCVSQRNIYVLSIFDVGDTKICNQQILN